MGAQPGAAIWNRVTWELERCQCCQMQTWTLHATTPFLDSAWSTTMDPARYEEGGSAATDEHRGPLSRGTGGGIRRLAKTPEENERKRHLGIFNGDHFALSESGVRLTVRRMAWV